MGCMGNLRGATHRVVWRNSCLISVRMTLPFEVTIGRCVHLLSKNNGFFLFFFHQVARTYVSVPLPHWEWEYV